jgi:hypothetical protein
MGQCSVFCDQAVIHSSVQLPMHGVFRNAVAATCVDGEPCIAIAGCGKGAGVYLRHAVTLDEVRLLPYKEIVCCLCINATGTKLFFGTQSGWICWVNIGFELWLMHCCRACWWVGPVEWGSDRAHGSWWCIGAHGSQWWQDRHWHWRFYWRRHSCAQRLHVFEVFCHFYFYNFKD